MIDILKFILFIIVFIIDCILSILMFLVTFKIDSRINNIFDYNYFEFTKDLLKSDYVDSDKSL